MAVAFDAKATTNAHTVGLDTSSLNLTGLTVGSGSNRALVAFVSIRDVNPPPSFTINWDATGTPQAMTLIASINNGNDYSYLYGLVNPTPGNKTLRLTTVGTHLEVFLDAASFTGVKQTGGTATFAHAATNTGTSSTISVTVTSAAGNMTVDSVNAPEVISSPTKTLIYADNSGSFTSGAASRASGAATNTHQWNLGSAVPWASVGCDIVAAPAALSAPTDLRAMQTDAAQVDISWSGASGGTAPYSYQLQRAPDSGGAPGTYANLGSPQAGTTYSDTTVSEGSTYWYRVVVTDNDSVTANSNADSVEIVVAQGLSFPSNADLDEGEFCAIEFNRPDLDGLPLFGPSNAGVTVIREVNVRQQTPESKNGSYYYAQFWYARSDNSFEPNTHYWGFHPYPQSGNPGTDPDSYWELAGLGAGADHIDTRDATNVAPEFDRWYRQGFRISKSGTTETGIFYFDLPSTEDGNVIEGISTGTSYGETPFPAAQIWIGDSPWAATYQHERFSGIQGRIKIFDIVLSESDMLSEAADMSQIVTSEGLAHIWYGKNGFFDIDDLECDYGTGRSFSWVDEDFKATLTPLPASSSVLTADPGSYAITGTDASLEQGYSVSAESGSFSISGTDASLEQGYEVAADAGSYLVTGTDASFLHSQAIAADAGSYSITGTASSLLVGNLINAEVGSYVITGTDVSLEQGYEIACDAGSYSTTGQDATFVEGFGFAAESGVYAVTGVSVSFVKQWQIAAAVGVYTITGVDATLTKAGDEILGGKFVAGQVYHPGFQFAELTHPGFQAGQVNN